MVSSVKMGSSHFRLWQENQWQQFSLQGFPTRAMENWRYTDTRALSTLNMMQRPIPAAMTDAAQSYLENAYLADAHIVVFVNGYYMPQLSRLAQLPAGVRLTDLQSAMADPLFLEKLPEKCYITDHYQTPFSLLNNGLFANGLFLHVSAGTVLDRPIQFIYFTDSLADQTTNHGRNFILLEENTETTILFEYIGANTVTYFNNIVTQIEVGHQAALQCYQLQKEGDAAFHISNTIINQKKNSQVASFCFSVSGKLNRIDLNHALQDPGAGCQLWGFYQAKLAEHVDYHTRIDHCVPNCMSQQYYKGIVDENAHAVFNGKIKVHASAKKTIAHQSNKNLLLSETAQIDTKPELEIYADDIQCTHGVTVGQLSPDALFYLQSRGIEKETAETMLLSAFGCDIIDAIPHRVIREKISRECLW